jgi:hypothetical protein
MIPPEKRFRFVWSARYTLDPGATNDVTVAQNFYPSRLTRPTDTDDGNQPFGFDQMAVYYKNYVPLRESYRIEWIKEDIHSTTATETVRPCIPYVRFDDNEFFASWNNSALRNHWSFRELTNPVRYTIDTPHSSRTTKMVWSGMVPTYKVLGRTPAKTLRNKNDYKLPMTSGQTDAEGVTGEAVTMEIGVAPLITGAGTGWPAKSSTQQPKWTILLTIVNDVLLTDRKEIAQS